MPLVIRVTDIQTYLCYCSSGKPSKNEAKPRCGERCDVVSLFLQGGTTMKRMVVCLVGIVTTLVLLPALVFGGPSSPTPIITALVVDVVDSNTIVVNILAVSDASPVFVGDTVYISLIGIELTQSGKAFWEANSNMSVNRTVYLAVDPTSAISWQDGDEPLPAYIYLDPEGKTLADSLLISMGFAKAIASSTNTHEATSVAMSEAQAEASSSRSAEASTSASTVATSKSSVSTPVKSTAITTVLPRPGGCCCCACACPVPEPINLLYLTTCVRQGNYAKLEIEAVPGAWYKIEVGYPSYLSTDLDLSPRRASCRVVRWQWKVYLQTPPGTWPITVIARLDGKIIGRLDTSITVRR